MTSVRYKIDPDEAYDLADQDRLLRQDRGEFMQQLELDFGQEAADAAGEWLGREFEREFARVFEQEYAREFGTGSIQRDGTG